jgi:hypothetical protein
VRDYGGPAGLDGVPARRRRGGPDRQSLRQEAGPQGFGLSPDLVERHLYRTAEEHACPEPRLQTYTNEGRPAEFDALCEGDRNFNGFYGYGIVDAYAAVKTPLRR